jgi:hypothetical protein
VSALDAVLDRLPGRGTARDTAEGVRDDFKSLGKSEGVLLSGGRVRLRFAQSTLWSVVAGFLGAGFIAGLYDGLFEINWYVHAGTLHFEVFYLKNWWDHLVRYGWWALYRHGAFRDIPEPAFATMAVKTLLAKRKWWSVRVPTWRVVSAPFAVVGLTLALGVLGVWLVNFSLPWLWERAASAAGHPGFKVSAHFIGKLSVPQLVLGLAIGLVIHRVWAPVGATLQGVLLDRAVDRRQAVVLRAGEEMDRAVEIDNAGWHIIPAWVRLPLSPPVIRERFAEMWRGNASVETRKGHRWVIVLVAVLVFLVMLLGLVGAHWAGTGHTVPYLFPAS